MQSRSLARLEGVLWALALAGLAVLAGFTAWLGARALAHPYQLLYGEGLMLEFARRLAAGEPLYKPLAQFPLGTCNYPPLPLALAGLTFPLFGLGYAAGRIWSLLATLAVAAILYLWVRRATNQRLPAAAAALAWLGAPYVYHWAPQFRVDLPGLAFSLAGMYVVWRNRSRRAVYAAAPLFVLGLYCKQSFFAAPAAAVLGLLLSRRPRQAWALTGLTLALGGMPFVALTVATRGAFWTSLVSTNVNLFQLSRLAAQVADLIRTYPVLIVLSATYLAGQGRAVRDQPSDDGEGPRVGRAHLAPPDRTVPDSPQENACRDRLVAIYLVLAVLTVALAGKAGSWENYFLEPLAVLCLGAGLALGRLRSARVTVRALAPLLVLLQGALMWHTPTEAAGLLRTNAASNQAMQPVVASTPGLVLSEDAGLLVQAGKPVPTYDFQLTQLALAGRWDQGWEIQRLREGAFSMVIFEYDTRLNVEQYGRYTRDFVSALDYGYRLTERVDKYRVYRPAPLDRERPVGLEGGLALVGHTVPPAVAAPGETLAMDIVWQATEPIPRAYTSFLHLLDESGQGFVGDDHEAWNGLYPTTRWAEGEMVRMSYTLTLPADLPRGLYTLHTGWYDDGLVRLRTETGASTVPLAIVQVPGPGQEPGDPPVTQVNAQFASGIHLEGHRLVQEPGTLRLSLIWWTDRFLATDYTVFVHLRNGQGQTVAQGDSAPGGGAWPTTLWPPEVRIPDAHAVSLLAGASGAGLPAGEYELVIGLYDPATGDRLPLLQGGDALFLGTVRVR
jgi:hypothetical protein